MIPELRILPSPIETWTGSDLIQILDDFLLCRKNGDNNSQKIRLGFEVLSELCTNHKKRKHCLEFIESHFKILPLTEHLDLLHKIEVWQENSRTNFSELKAKWEAGTFSLTDLYMCVFIGQLFLNSNISTLLSQHKLSSEAQDLMWLMNKTGDIYIEKNVTMTEMVYLESYFNQNCDEMATTTRHVAHYLHILKILQLFGPKSRLLLGTLPFPNNRILDEWAVKLKDRVLPPNHFVDEIAEEVIHINQEVVMQKIHHLVSQNGTFSNVLDQEKFTKQEMLMLLAIRTLFKNSPDLEDQITPAIGDFRSRIIPYCLPHEQNPVTLAVHNQYDEISELFQDSESVIEKIILFITRFFLNIFAYYGHVFLIHYDEQKASFVAYGKKCTNTTYGRIYPLPSKFVENYKIDIQATELSDAEKQRFAKRFQVKLETLINIKRRNPPLGFLGLYELFLPSFTATRPEDVHFKEGERLSCVQYAAQAIIQAHVETCREFNEPIPNSLEFYGFKKTQRIDRLRPIQLVTALRSKGILKPLFKPYLSDRSLLALGLK